MTTGNDMVIVVVIEAGQRHFIYSVATMKKVCEDMMYQVIMMNLTVRMRFMTILVIRVTILERLLDERSTSVAPLGGLTK